MAASVATSSRKTRLAAVRTRAALAASSATVVSVVRLSTKKSPRLASTPETTRMTRASAVAAEPMWLFTPTAPGTESRSESRVAAISSSDWARKTTPGPGRTPGKPRGSMGRWSRTSLPDFCSRRAVSPLAASAGRTAVETG